MQSKDVSYSYVLVMRGGWVSVLCGLLCRAALPGLVLSTTLKDLAIVRGNTTFTMKSSHDLPLLSAFNESLAHESVFIRAGGLYTETMGNLLALYFDALACCNILGVHFVYRAGIGGDEQATKFFNSFPQIYVHPRPSNVTSEELSNRWIETCPYVYPFPLVHKGAWNQRPHMIAQIMRNAVSTVFPAVLNETIPVTSFAHILPEKMTLQVLPLVPSAAIVFRCTDILNFHSGDPNYGFLNFNAYKELIPHNATTIYVLSEELNYQTHRAEYAHVCPELSQCLIQFLNKQFPRAIVALRRGHAIDSVAMLSNAATVVSAPSSFTLFPGMANPNRVYLMASGKRPVFFDQPFVHKNFMWLYSPVVIMGADVIGSDKKKAVKKLTSALTHSLSHPVAYATHLPEVDYCAKLTLASSLECVKGL